VFLQQNPPESRNVGAGGLEYILRLVAQLGLVGWPSHSGRRSFINQAARKASLVGGSLRDVMSLGGHASLSTTNEYFDVDAEAQSKLLNII
jgi:integrase